MEKIIHLLTENDRKSFVRYLRQRNKRNDVRNIDLFRRILDRRTAPLQQELGVNAYNALKKRLKDNLIEFCGSLLFEREATTERDLQKRILIARKLLETGESKEAVKLLKRAEEQARSINSFALLNEVYH